VLLSDKISSFKFSLIFLFISCLRVFVLLDEVFFVFLLERFFFFHLQATPMAANPPATQTRACLFGILTSRSSQRGIARSCSIAADVLRVDLAALSRHKAGFSRKKHQSLHSFSRPISITILTYFCSVRVKRDCFPTQR